MSSTTLEPVKNDTDQGDGMIHLADLNRGGLWALCGKRCREDLGWTHGEVDCVVCEDLWRHRTRRYEL